MENVANDFYEDDEPLHEVLAAFNSAPKGLTGLPMAAAVHELWQVTVTQAVEQTPRSGVRRVESFGPVLQHARA
jgi:hypothetical protein